MKKNSTTGSIQGVPVARLANGFVLVRTRALKAAATPAAESAHRLVAAAARALSQPGLPRSSVFTGAPGIHAYSVDLNDPAKLVRESEDGSLAVGTIVRGQFQELPGGPPTEDHVHDQ